MKKNIWLVIFSVMPLLSSCRRNIFLQFESDTDTIQIFVKPEGVLKAKNIGQNGGQEMLQLFDTSFHLTEEIILNSTDLFKVNKWEKNTIELKFFTTDFEHFKYWLFQNKYKPQQLGRYRINFTHGEIRESSDFKEVQSDSIYIDKRKFIVSFFLRGRMIDRVKLDSLSISKKQIFLLDFDNKVFKKYNLQGKITVDKYMKEITKIYDN